MEKENGPNISRPPLGSRSSATKPAAGFEPQKGPASRPRRVSSRMLRPDFSGDRDTRLESPGKKRKRNDFESEDSVPAGDAIADSPSGKRRKFQDQETETSSLPKPEGPGRKLVNKIITRTQSISHFVRNTPLKFGSMRKKSWKDSEAPDIASDFVSASQKSSSVASFTSSALTSPFKSKGSAQVSRSSSSSLQSKRDHLQHSVSVRALPTRKRSHRGIVPARFSSEYPPIIAACAGWIPEHGSTGKSVSYDTSDPNDAPIVADRLYSEIFAGKDHANFLADDEKIGLVSISLLKELGEYKAMIRTSIGADLVIISADDVKGGTFSKQGVKPILKAAAPALHLHNIRQVKSEKHEQELKLFEANEVHIKFKWGVLLCKKGQLDENEMFQNQDGSQEFQEFLSFLGDDVELLGFDRYSGGLDTSRNATGERSVYTKFQDQEIMFHVSTLMPFTEGCQQQLERKRHIGNDIVVIVFQEGCGDQYNPSTITTHFQHILAVVQVESGTGTNGIPTRYRVQFARKEGVPEFGPALPGPAVFEAGPEFREFFLQKLLNGERAALKAPAFERAISRTRSGFLQLYSSQYPKSY